MKIAVCTSLDTIDPAYSITHVVLDQLTMLVRAGHEPVLFTRQGNLPDILPLPDRRIVPVRRLFGYVGAETEINSDDLVANLSGFPVIFTHDLISHTLNRPIADALADASPRLTTSRIFHWIHSIPCQRHPWWDLNRYGPDPTNHSLVYMNCTHARAAAEQFKTTRDRVVVIPPTVDLRTLYEWEPILWNIVDAVPGLQSADMVQVYPAAADRLSSKGVGDLIRLFGAAKDSGQSVCCVVVDSWTQKLPKENLMAYRVQARKNGLSEDEFVFMSEVIPNFKSLTRRQVVSLMQYSNVCAATTLGEAFGLFLPEACLAGGAFPVTNHAAPNLAEVVGDNCREVEFGGLTRSLYGDIATELVNFLKGTKSVAARDIVRKRYNLDAVYRNHYEPLLQRIVG